VLAATAVHAAGTNSQPAVRDFPMRVSWGDTHLHTNMSVDANGMDNRELSPDAAYRFARGEAVRAHNGQEVRRETGGRVLAIPHNGNLSNGKKFLARGLRRQADRRRLRKHPAALGADLRDDADQG
jgi:hypothetical protein